MKMAEELPFRGGIDEFIVDGDNIDVIHNFKEKTERLFQVQINFDSVAKLEDKRKQWITVQGEKIDRKNAKEYIIGLCQPGTVQEFCIKGYGEDQLTEEAIEEIEKHTNAAICPINRDMVQIRGTDLAVILAVSSLESIVGQHEMDTETDGAIKTPKEGRDDHEDEGNTCLSRLDTTLRRALSNQSDVTCSIDDYNKTSPSIKMTLLKCMSDFRDIDDSELFPSTGSSCGPTSYKLPVYMDDDDDENVDNIDGGPANPNAFNHVNNSGKEKISPVQNITKKLGHVSVSPSSSPKPQKIVAPDTPEHQYLRRFGLSVGYSAEEVEEGLLYVDQKTKPADFLEMLNKIKQKNSFDCDEKHSNIATAGSIHDLENEDLGIDQSNDQDDNSKNSFPPPPDIPTGDNSGIIGRRSLPQDYKKRLIKDFTEENSELSVTELKRRNEERQKMLKVAFDKNQSEKQKIEENQNTGKSSKKKKRRKKNKNKKQEKDSGKNDENLPGKSSQNEKSNVTIHVISSDDDMEDEEETRVLKLWQINENKPSSGSDDDCKIVDVVGTKPVLHQPKVQPNTTNQHWPQPTSQHQPRQQAPWFPTQPPVMPYMRYPPPPLPQYMSPHAYPPRPYMNSPVAQLPQGPIKNPKGPLTSKQLRYVVIDGSNVAMCHGNGKVFSCKGIQIVVDYFLKRGHKQVTAFVPEWRKYNPRPENPISNQDVLEKLKSEGHLVFTPSRRLNGRLIVSYDDRFVLELAEREDGIIVSNDQYRDLMGEKVSWRKIIEERLLLFSFAGDNFMPPFDPLGRDGPTLDDFLCKPTGRKRSASPISSHINAWQQRDCPPAVKQRGYPNSRGHPNNLNFPGTPRFQHNYQGQKQQSAGNHDGFAHRGRGRGGHMNNPNSPRRQQNLTGRSDEKTKELEEQLKAIFPDEQEKILEILNNHKCEIDLPKLTNYLMNAIFPS